MLNIFGMSRKVAREGTETRLTPVHWAKKGRCMHGNLVVRDGYGDTRDIFAVCRHRHRTESFLPVSYSNTSFLPARSIFSEALIRKQRQEKRNGVRQPILTRVSTWQMENRRGIMESNDNSSGMGM